MGREKKLRTRSTLIEREKERNDEICIATLKRSFCKILQPKTNLEYFRISAKMLNQIVFIY